MTIEENMMHTFDLNPGEIIHIAGVPYRYVGNGKAEGGTNPAFARSLRDDQSGNGEQTPNGE